MNESPPERASARDLVAALCAGFEEFPAEGGDPDSDGPLGWPGYGQQRRNARGSGSDESVLSGQGRIGGYDAVLVVFEFGFLGGSLGQDAGERIVSAFERARRLRLPLVSVLASGGSRVQEGIRALTELQRIARASVLARQAGIPHIAVLREPTTGGTWAVLGASADIVLATPRAAIAFGGSRVRSADDTGTAFTAEGKYEHGQVDRIVPDAELPGVLASAVALLHPFRRNGPPEPADVPQGLGTQELPKTGWEAVRLARSPNRPRAPAYLDRYLDVRFDLSGDRVGAPGHGMLCGIGERDGRPVAYAAQTGAPVPPAGFRTAARLIQLADQFGLAVLTLVDTPGATADAEAERNGIGPAVAGLYHAVARATVPITTLVIGEGGSGGALALAAPERTWITRDAYFAVISPEASASILKRPADQAPVLADLLRLRPQDLVELGFARDIV